MKWHYTPQGVIYKGKIQKQKVCRVTEHITSISRTWRGELNNDDYFVVVYLDGVISVATGPHEMMLPYEMIQVTYEDLVKKIMSDMTSLVYLSEDIKEELYDILNGITFKDIMKMLDWKYSSKKVEVEEFDIK
jgi:hypothetical protein